jgi:hypothetical protein
MCETKPLLLSLLFCGFLFANTAGAQFLSEEPLNTSLDQSYPVKLYYNAVGENAHIYNGYEYMTPDRNIKGSPYFTDALVPATISYDDTYYQNIRILYDMVHDQVIINRLDQNFRISLINTKLNSFSIKNHDFVRIDKDSLHGVDLSTGFYDRVYSGKSTVLVKRKKFVKEVLEYTLTSMSYMEENFYYVKIAGNYVEVKNKSSVFNLFQNKKSEIKSYLRKNKLSFKSDFEKTLIATCAYYDQLTS